MGLLSFGAGLALGYVLGTKDGRSQFERIRSSATDTWHDPKVQDAVQKAEESAQRIANDVAHRSKEAAAAAADSIRQALNEGLASAGVSTGGATEQSGSGGSGSSDQGAQDHRHDVVSDPALSTEDQNTDWSDEGGSPRSATGSS